MAECYSIEGLSELLKKDDAQFEEFNGQENILEIVQTSGETYESELIKLVQQMQESWGLGDAKSIGTAYAQI